MDLLDELPCAVLVTDENGCVLHANAELLSLSGRTLAACHTMPMDRLFTAASRIFLQTHVWPSLLRLARMDEVYLQLTAEGGTFVPVLVNSRLGRYQGAPAYLWSIFVARQRQEFEGALLDARRRAEESLHLKSLSDQFTRSVADLIPGMVAFWDLELRCRFANAAHQAWFGKPPAELLGIHLRELLGEQNFAAIEPHVRGVLAGHAQSFERERTTPCGHRGHAQASYIPHVVNGQVTGFLVLVNDISSLKNAEAALRQEVADRQLVLDQLARSTAALNEAQRLGRIGSWVWQVQGDVVTWSDELFGILGCEPAQGAPSFAAQARLYAPESYARLQDRVARALATGEPYALELAIVRPDGAGAWVEARGECLRDAQGQVCGLRGTLQDITTRHRAELGLAAKTLALQRSNEDLERFAYVASHDLQEPLRMVTSYGQLLTRRHLSDLKPEAQEFVAYMVDGGQRAQALIRDLLSLARLDSQGKRWRPVPLEATLAEALQPLRLRLQETGARITHDPLPTVVGDAGQLRQLLANLLGNALKFCGQAPPIVHLAAAREAEGWRISVRDNGIGIDPRYFGRIFQMFQRLHLRADYEGTGIGLAICKKVVERHGGAIEVVSMPGQGATFSFTLPDRPAGQPAAPSSAAQLAC